MFVGICHPVCNIKRTSFHAYIYLLHICITESQEGKSMMNGDSRFIINLSQDQKDQYGSQFEEEKLDETPSILGELSN